MGLFDNMLKGNESLFKNPDALEYEFMPKMFLYREQEQRKIASVIAPLFQEKTGRNAFIFGPPGIGKTLAMRKVIDELEEKTDDIVPLYINCWNKNTTFKILIEMCDQLDFKFTQNKRTEELLKIVKQLLNKKSAVFIFDEIDKVEDFDFLYNMVEDIYKKSIIIITNYREWLTDLDERIKSRLLPEMIEFKQYTAQETDGILKQRRDYAFHAGVWDDDAFRLIAQKTAEAKDIRTGLYLMKESGNLAESKSSRKITLHFAAEAVSKVKEFQSKDQDELIDDEQTVLDIIKENSGQKIGDLFKVYEKQGGKLTYKTFQRRIDKLEKGNFIQAQKTDGGKEGNTTIVHYGKIKKLTEF
jgi:archaeal cell division control protein 6